jgi:NADPH-dependent 2,4-dienoyl-CoA reductase/sulfur reductase-like enzyme
VTLFEAAERAGGQVLLAARASWRQDLAAIIDWRLHEISRLGVSLRLGCLAEAADVLEQQPEVVIIATGGLPDLSWLDGAEHATSVWDALSGNVPFGTEIIVYDGTGRHPGPQAAELAARGGRQVSLVSIDPELAKELTYVERLAWKKRLYQHAIPMSFDFELERLESSGNRITATFRSLVTEALLVRTADQVIVEHGTLPADELFRDLQPMSYNEGVTDITALLAGQAQPSESRRDGRFALYSIGDAVASRNIHTAVLDALRLCRTL